MSDHEGHGHKAIVYKSHFPPLRHSVVTETPADTLANKPRLLQRPKYLFFMPPRQYSTLNLVLNLDPKAEKLKSPHVPRSESRGFLLGVHMFISEEAQWFPNDLSLVQGC